MLIKLAPGIKKTCFYIDQTSDGGGARAGASGGDEVLLVDAARIDVGIAAAAAEKFRRQRREGGRRRVVERGEFLARRRLFIGRRKDRVGPGPRLGSEARILF